MTTNSTDSETQDRKSWKELSQRASSELPPGDLDIRIPLRVQLERDAPTRASQALVASSLMDDLLALSRLRPLRISLAAAAMVAAALFAEGAATLREIEELLYFYGLF